MVELINKNKFAESELNYNSENFSVPIASFRLGIKMRIYIVWKN